MVIHEQYTGPIPPPDVFSGFEDVMPGLANRVMVLAEETTAHHRAMERSSVDGARVEGVLARLTALFCPSQAWVLPA
jgi:uncharacterized membrane protein